MLDGLRETSRFIHCLLNEVINEVGVANVVLGGLSQGCAATLISLLTWEGAPLAAVFGFCGWLPLRQHMMDVADPRLPSDEEDPFARDSDPDQEADLPTQAIAWLREEIDLPATSGPSSAVSGVAPTTSPTSSSNMPYQQIPIFLAHGTEDDKVDVQLGKEASACLTILGADTEWKEYGGLGHWYSEAMLGDLVDFLTRKTGWTQNLEVDEEKESQEGNANIEQEPIPSIGQGQDR